MMQVKVIQECSPEGLEATINMILKDFQKKGYQVESVQYGGDLISDLGGVLEYTCTAMIVYHSA